MRPGHVMGSALPAWCSWIWAIFLRAVQYLYTPVPHPDLSRLPELLLAPRGVVDVLSHDPARHLVSMRPKRSTLVLDVDGTLAYTEVEGLRISRSRRVPDASFDAQSADGSGRITTYSVWRRPHLELFLREAARHFRIVVFTAARKEYADPLIDLLDPHCVIRQRLYRSSCRAAAAGPRGSGDTEGSGLGMGSFSYVKDLSLVQCDLSQVVLLDDSPAAYAANPENVIPCSSYSPYRRMARTNSRWQGRNSSHTRSRGRGDDTGDNTYVLDRDEELLDLIPFLLLLKDLRDVRSVLRLRVRHHSKECTTAADTKCTTVKAAMRVEEKSQ